MSSAGDPSRVDDLTVGSPGDSRTGLIQGVSATSGSP